MEEADGHRVLTFDQAQAMARERASVAQNRGPLRVAEAVEDYIQFLRVERKTSDDAQRRAAVHILPSLGSTRVSDLTTDQLVRWRDGLVKGGGFLRGRKKNGERRRKAEPLTADHRRARQATANRTWSILRGALNRAFKLGIVHDDLAWRRVKPFKNVSAARPGHLSVQECQRLLNAADATSGFRDLVHAALQSGCRYGELCRLRVRDYGRGKLVIHEAKSGKPRDVVLSEEGEQFFEQLVAGRSGEEFMLRNQGRILRAVKTERAQAELAGVEPDFTSIEQDPGDWRPSEQSRPMLEACRSANISPPIGFHGLRHTWASLSIESGLSLILAARNLGHSDTRMVEKFYGHLVEDFVSREIRKSAPTFGVVAQTNVRPLRRTPD
jgi:integrase